MSRGWGPIAGPGLCFTRSVHPVIVYDRRGASWARGEKGASAGPRLTVTPTTWSGCREGDHTVRKYTLRRPPPPDAGTKDQPSDTGYDGVRGLAGS